MFSEIPLVWQILLSILTVSILLIALLLLIYVALINHANGSLRVDGKRRSFILYVPPALDPSKPVPLVISMHGLADWPANQKAATEWNRLADQHRFYRRLPARDGLSAARHTDTQSMLPWM
jgi:poly(3-hydroxybutyrate) depolymerase